MKNFLFTYNIDVFIAYTSISFVFIEKTLPYINNVTNMMLLFVGNIFGIIGVYFFNKITDNNEDSVNGNALPLLHKKNLIIITFVFFFLAFLSYKNIDKPYILEGGGLLFLLGILYSFPKKIRLKKIPLIKNIIPSFCWFFSLVLLLYASSAIPFLIILKISLPIFVLAFIFEILWDIPDVKGDLHAGIKTIPALIPTPLLQIILILILSPLFFLKISIANKIFGLIFVLFIATLHKNPTKEYFRKFLMFLSSAIVLQMLLF